MRSWLGLTIAIAGLVCSVHGSALAQSSSLYGAPDARGPLLLNQNSWTYLKVEPPRQIQLNDILTVIVDEKSQMISEAEAQSRQQSRFDARLRDWLRLDGFGITPAPQTNGDPRVNASLDKQNRALSELETVDSLRFRVAARVVDIRPNGNLIVEARRTIRNNDEEWEQSLTGEIRPEDVLPNNTVLSEDVAELRIFKRETGTVRDSYRRGWLQQTLDYVKAF